jgi:hypothetical protein
MVRRYEESIEVRTGEGAVGFDDTATRSRNAATGSYDAATGSRVSQEGCGGIDVQSPAPSAFLWRGRLYVVREVIGHWRERRAWWREALDPDEAVAARGLDSLEQEVWRVEASAGRLAGTGVYDLGMNDFGTKDFGTNEPARSWRLLRVAD